MESPAPDLTPEQKKERQLARKRANYKAYYERNKEAMRQRSRENYDPDRKKEYYEARKDVVREYNKQYYVQKKKTSYSERLDAIIAKCEGEPAFASVFARIKDVAHTLSERELLLFESLVEIKETVVENTSPTENNSV